MSNPAFGNLTPGTAYTGPLVFSSSAGGNVAGPIGALSSNVAGSTFSLSADGQSYNLTTPASGAVTLTWTDPANNVASFSATFTDQTPPPPVITGAFGQPTPGTTA